MSAASLKAHTLSGIKWNSIGQFGRQAISFFVSIALARLLTPAEFGLIAMLLIFQEMANALINSGLNAPLIQQPDISAQDCSTIFYFNVAVGLACYALLAACAPDIASFYQEPRLDALTKYYGFVFLVHAFGNVQIGLLIRDLNYKQLNIVSLIGVLISAIVAIGMALRNGGVYSLLGQHISYALTTTSLYWITSKWRPTLTFSGSSFRRLFSFGSKVLLVSLLDKMLATIDHLFIGKLQGPDFLGQYSRGKATRDLPISSITTVIISLVFPVFSKIQGPLALRAAHARFIGIVTYLAAPMMVGMAVLAEPLIIVLYSDKWIPAAFFLQLFCAFGITVPLNSVLVQMVMSTGRSGTFLKLEVYKKTVILVSMAIGLFLGPVGLVLAMAVGHYAALVISMIVAAGILGTSPMSIARHMLPGVSLALLAGVPVYLTNMVSWGSSLYQLLVPAAVGLVCHVALSALLKSGDYVFVKSLVTERLSRRR